MERDMIELQFAAMPVSGKIPVGKSLTERLQFAMRYVREHENDLFWMSAHATDDLKFRTALSAVMLAGSEGDRNIIERSVKPMRMLNAAMQGIPVDFGSMPTDDDMLPLMKLWRDSEQPNQK